MSRSSKIKFARKIKQIVGCQDCGKEGPTKILHFHHVDEQAKVKEISNMTLESRYTLDDVKNEIKKCKIVCKKCHINIHSRTRDECINALEYVAEKLGKSPSKREYSEYKRDTDPSYYAIRNVFDTWNDAKEAANLTTNTSSYNTGYTCDECINALEYVAEKLGKSPTKREYSENRRDTDPSSKTVYNVFDSWNDAKQDAGLKTVGEGEMYTNRDI
jgi:hypothetical protein